MTIEAYPVLVAAAPVAGLVLNVIVQVLISGSTAGRKLTVSVLVGFFVNVAFSVLATLAGCLWAGFPKIECAALATVSLISSVGLGYGYFTFVNLNVASVRIRLIKELSGKPRGLADGELAQLYNADGLASMRIDRLIGWRQLKETNGRFRIDGKLLLWIAGFIELMKIAILGHGSRMGRKQPAHGHNHRNEGR